MGTVKASEAIGVQGAGLSHAGAGLAETMIRGIVDISDSIKNAIDSGKTSLGELLQKATEIGVVAPSALASASANTVGDKVASAARSAVQPIETGRA